MNALIWLVDGAGTRLIAEEQEIPGLAPSQKAQAEAGPLIPMMRRANMGASIAKGGGNRKGLTR